MTTRIFPDIHLPITIFAIDKDPYVIHYTYKRNKNIDCSRIPLLLAKDLREEVGDSKIRIRTQFHASEFYYRLFRLVPKSWYEY